MGDKGKLTGEDFSLDVLYTKKPLEGIIVHNVLVKRGALKVWAKVNAHVDEEHRNAIRRNHTATHLLHKALHDVLGDHVKQAGSLVAADRLRFDFTHFSSVSPEELREVEDAVNEQILSNIQLKTMVEDAEAAVASGATALFGEKYGDKVRVVSIGEYSKELCGGTHCSATGDIGPFVIESEGSVASGIRRIEALTGKGALGKMANQRLELSEIAALLKASESPREKVQQLMEELKASQKEKERLQGAAMRDASGDLISQARDIDGTKVLSTKVQGLNAKDLRSLADKIRDKMASGVIVLASIDGDQASLMAMVTKDLTSSIKAGDILKQVAQACNGRGGGKPDMAQGGTKDISNIDEALSLVFDIVKNS
jgi:alanyl-tRNA synthetase